MNIINNNSINIYISTLGNDNWSGCFKESNETDSDGPLATIEGALKKLRLMKMRGEVTKPVNVYLRGGRYEIYP